MSAERMFHLEQALLAVIAAAEQQGIAISSLRKQAIGGLIANTDWHWATAEYMSGAIDEVERAVKVLRDLH